MLHLIYFDRQIKVFIASLNLINIMVDIALINVSKRTTKEIFEDKRKRDIIRFAKNPSSLKIVNLKMYLLKLSSMECLL